MAEINNFNIQELQEKLLEWFQFHHRTFSWRSDNLTHYELVIAEVLLQRTKAETVSKFFNHFVLEFPSWQSIVDTDIERLEAFLKPVGLYRQRAKRLKDLAMEMVKRKGVFPSKRQELESIPFLGQYISNAVELLIFKKPLPLLDVNMARVLERYYGKRKMADIRYDPYLQELSALIVNIQAAKELNWAILDFAALICKAHKPICESCFLKGKCAYFNAFKALDLQEGVLQI